MDQGRVPVVDEIYTTTNTVAVDEAGTDVYTRSKDAES